MSEKTTREKLEERFALAETEEEREAINKVLERLNAQSQQDPLLNNPAIQKELAAKELAESEVDLSLDIPEDIDDEPMLSMDNEDEEVKTELGRKLTYSEVVALEETDNWQYLRGDEFDLSTFPNGYLPESCRCVLTEECPICGQEKGLDYLLNGKIVCKVCYDKLKSLKNKKELFEWLKEIGVEEEEELIPEQDEEYSGDNP